MEKTILLYGARTMTDGVLTTHFSRDVYGTAPSAMLDTHHRDHHRRATQQLASAFVIAVTLLCAHAAQAQKVILPLTLHWQETSQWCWAASGQMLMEFLGPREVPQCYEADQRLARSDCCSCPTPNKCVKPGWPDLSTWGYNSKQTNWGTPLSWSQVINEINAGRPFMFSWAWNSGGAHAMVAYGYFNFNGSLFNGLSAPFAITHATYWVYIANPLPSQGRCGSGGDASGPFGGDDEVVTYSEFVGGSGYNHTHGADIYNISHQ